VERDPIGLKGGTNLFVYSAGDPIRNSDPTGLVKRGSGWSTSQWHEIQQAEGAIRQELHKACECNRDGSTSCIPCEVVSRLLSALNNSTVSEAPLYNVETKRSDCGLGMIGGSGVFLSPAAFTDACPKCLAINLYHELLHNAGLDHDPSPAGPGINDLENRCMNNLCKKGGK
jgi:hypothetical protein